MAELEAEALPPPPEDDWRDRVLDDFRRWLHELPSGPPPAAQPDPGTDLHGVLAELTALRQEARLSTREQARAVRELNRAGELNKALADTVEGRPEEIAALEARVRRASERRCLLPLLGVRDAIARGRAASAAVAAERRWFRFRPAGIDGVVEGYDMAVDRFDRVLAELGAHRVKTVGETFDPTTMNAVEACPPAAGADAGQVVGEHRSGFVFGDGETLRLADVVVTRAGAVAPVTADEERVRDDS